MKVAPLEKFYLMRGESRSWGPRGGKVGGTRFFFLQAGGELTLDDTMNWSSRKRCENCSRLRMKTLQWCRWRRSSVIIVNCEHISNFVLIVDFEQANVFWVQIENTFEGKIEYVMHYVVVYFRWQQNLPTNIIWSYTITFLRVKYWEIFAKELTSDVNSG